MILFIVLQKIFEKYWVPMESAQAINPANPESTIPEGP
jgi:hypothetical protein